MMLVHKTAQDDYVQAWWQRMIANKEFRQARGLTLSSGILSYTWVDGRPPTSYDEYASQLAAVWATDVGDAAKILRPKHMDLDEYCSRISWHSLSAQVSLAIKRLPAREFTPVEMVHGDPSFSNVVIQYRDSQPVLLDPGFHRGLCCRELDEAKVLQSYDGFEEVYRCICRPLYPPPFTVRRIHWLLLITHYIRLLRHVTCHSSLVFASQRILDLTGEYT